MFPDRFRSSRGIIAIPRSWTKIAREARFCKKNRANNFPDSLAFRSALEKRPRISRLAPHIALGRMGLQLTHALKHRKTKRDNENTHFQTPACSPRKHHLAKYPAIRLSFRRAAGGGAKTACEPTSSARGVMLAFVRSATNVFRTSLCERRVVCMVFARIS